MTEKVAVLVKNLQKRFKPAVPMTIDAPSIPKDGSSIPKDASSMTKDGPPMVKDAP
jgi:hypothetical protein